MANILPTTALRLEFSETLVPEGKQPIVTTDDVAVEVQLNNFGGVTGFTSLTDKLASIESSIANIPNATTSKAGLMSPTDKVKLDSLEGYSLPIATASTLGGIRIGTGLAINSSTGVASVKTTTSLASGSTDIPTAGAVYTAVQSAKGLVKSIDSNTITIGNTTFKLSIDTEGKLSLVADVQKYTVTFNANGGSGTAPAAIQVNAGSPVTLPTTSITKTNYTFGGWNTNTAGTGTNYAAGASFTPAGNVTLYAKWNENDKYGFTKGTATNCTITPVTTKWYVNSTIPAQTKIATIAAATGYNMPTSVTLSNGAQASINQSTGEVTLTSAITLTKDVTISATATIKTYSVTLNIISGTIASGANPQTVNHGSKATWTVSPSSGYNLPSTVTNGTISGTTVTSNAITAATTVTVTCVAKGSVTVSGNIINGTFASSITDKYVGDTLAASTTIGKITASTNYNLPTSITISHNGNTITGSIDTSGNVKISSALTLAGNITVTATCPIKTYTVTFNSQGGSTVASKTVNHGAAIGTLPTPTKDGYTLNGWYTAATGGTKITTATTITKSITFYAQWSEAAPQYSLTLPDGTDVTSLYKVTTTAPNTTNTYDTYKSLENIIEKDTTICCNKNFDMWYFNPSKNKWEDFGGTIKFNTTKNVWYYKIPGGIKWFLYIK